MTKTDYPPLHMVLDHGRLVPSSAYEQERLDSYPNGTPFTVKITSERGGRTMRRWWLVLGLAVRQMPDAMEDGRAGKPSNQAGDRLRQSYEEPDRGNGRIPEIAVRTRRTRIGTGV